MTASDRAVLLANARHALQSPLYEEAALVVLRACTGPYCIGRDWIRAIYRIENPRLWCKYVECCLDIQADNEAGERQGFAVLNEQLLWHGTSPEKAAAVCGQGFDLRVAASIGSYGRGAYFAYSSGIAAGYARQTHRAWNMPRLLHGRSVHYQTLASGRGHCCCAVWPSARWEQGGAACHGRRVASTRPATTRQWPSRLTASAATAAPATARTQSSTGSRRTRRTWCCLTAPCESRTEAKPQKCKKGDRSCLLQKEIFEATS